jgi:dTDP-4-dehydrorhamnose reductase
MKIFITGGEGQLGRELRKQLQGAEYLATDVAELDITDQKAAFQAIAAYRPDVVIHGAAYTNVDGSEANVDLAYRINAVGTQNMAAACLRYDAKMVYISTDYVFDGNLGRPYNEFDQPNPQGIYGKSKFAGETLAKHILNRLFIVRTAWLYGDGNNFVRTMLKLGSEKEELQVVSDQFGTPTSASCLANAILSLMHTEHYGVYHAACTGITSWYEFAKKIFELSGNTRVKVKPISTGELGRPAPRPPYSPLENRLLRLTVGDIMPRWEDALGEYLREEQLSVRKDI